MINRNDERWGDDIPFKSSEDDLTFILVFLNMNGVPEDIQEPKNEIVFNKINEFEIDIFSMVEVNLKLNELKDKDSIENRTLGWYKNLTTRHACDYQLTLDTAFQVGGTGIWAKDKASHRLFGSGIDP